MKNIMKNIVYRLEGLSYDNLAFEVVYFACTDEGFSLEIRAYCKDGVTDTSDFRARELAEIASRLSDKCLHDSIFCIDSAARKDDGNWSIKLTEVENDVQNN